MADKDSGARQSGVSSIYPAASNAPTAMPAKSTVSSSAPPIATAPPTATRDVAAEKLMDINISTKTDTETEPCLITGSSLLPAGDKMILVNHRLYYLKLLDLQTSKITSELKVSHATDVASITDDLVAVTTGVNRQIAFVTVTSVLKLDRIMNVDGVCTGIEHTNGKLIVALCDPVKIEIMDLYGKVEKTIHCPSTLYNWNSFLALSPDKNSIYVSDFEGQTIKKLNLNNGAVEAEYMYEWEKMVGLGFPGGIVVDQQGRVIVCAGGIRGNIHIFTADLTEIKPLVDGLKFPYSLSFCRSTGRLYVGMSANYNLKVYELS